MSWFFKIFAAGGLLVFALAGAGCGPGETSVLTAEVDDAAYREGQQLVKQGRPQEALANYLKIIARRSDSAPESHLEAALIYRQHIKDPIAAIYHFRKYLEQQPNSRQAPLVRQQIEAAKREFGRTLPNQPLDSREVRIEGGDQRDRLERENEQLRSELAVLRSGGLGGSFSAGSRPVLDNAREPALAVVAEAEPSRISLAPIQSRDGEAVVATPPASENAGARAKPTPPATGGGRRHTVAPKDSLYGIAKRYYGTATNARVQAIIDANRDVLPGGAATPLKEGMALKIP
jgi:tetratricopeptide (TPR) repeat protein